MAELVTVEGQVFKKRSPLGAWGLTLLTLGIYGLVWYYKINDEARRYLRDDSIKPGIALLALLPGAILIIPPFISYYHTGERIQRMQEKAGLSSTLSPALFLLASFVAGVHLIHGQEGLNKVWRTEVTRQGRRAGCAREGFGPLRLSGVVIQLPYRLSRDRRLHSPSQLGRRGLTHASGSERSPSTNPSPTPPPS